MKYIASLICMLLIPVSTPVLAMQGSECSAKSAKLIPAERPAFMKSCLAQAQDPNNVKEEERKQKSAQCEQNAKNKKLQGSDKTAYFTTCMNKNDAVAKASAQPANTAAPSNKTASPSGKTASPSSKSAAPKAAGKQKAHRKYSKKKKAKLSSKPAKAIPAQ